jgi:hypothetical protein
MIGAGSIFPRRRCDGGAVRRIGGDERKRATGVKDNKIRRKINRIRSPRERKKQLDFAFGLGRRHYGGR